MGFMGFIGDGAAYRPNVLERIWESLLQLLDRRERAGAYAHGGTDKARAGVSVDPGPECSTKQPLTRTCHLKPLNQPWKRAF